MSCAPHIYRAIAWIMFFPFGGLALIRKRLLDSLDLEPGTSVLELGCGPGDLTRELLRRGARVHAVDHSPDMLGEARRQAPGAELEQADLRSYVPIAKYDVAMFAFVLHELPPDAVRAIIERATRAVVPGGRLGVLDHNAPSGFAGTAWRALLRMIESSAIERWLGIDLSRIVRDAGLTIASDQLLAGGRVRLIVARPSHRHDSESLPRAAQHQRDAAP